MPELNERLGLVSPERRQFALLNLAYHLYESGQTRSYLKNSRATISTWHDAKN